MQNETQAPALPRTLIDLIPKHIESAIIIIEPGLTYFAFMQFVTPAQIEQARAENLTDFSYLTYERYKTEYIGGIPVHYSDVMHRIDL